MAPKRLKAHSLTEDTRTIAQLINSRDEKMRLLDESGLSAPAADAVLADIEDLNWKIAHAHATEIGEALSKAKLLAEVSGAVSPHTIEGALLLSLIGDLSELSS